VTSLQGETQQSDEPHYFHDGSAIITSVIAGTNTDGRKNIIVNNDRRKRLMQLDLEGTSIAPRIHGNLMCGNDGAGRVFV
jgi:hypothetical protein